MPITLSTNFRAFGDLLVGGLTSAFAFRWNDKGTGSKRDGAFWHPTGTFSSGGNNVMRPLGSVLVTGYGGINNNYAALPVGPLPGYSVRNSPVTPPWTYKRETSYSIKSAKSLNGRC
jgi:hypothetical protein